MNHRRVLACWCVVVVMLSSSPALAAPPLVKDGQPQAEIVIAEKPARMVRLAAVELQDYLLKISGAKLPISTTPTSSVPVHVYVGRSPHTDRLKVTEDGLKHGAFRMVAQKDSLVLLGRDRDFTPKEPHMIHNGDMARATAAWDKLTGEKWGYPHTQVYKHYSRELKIWEQDERGSLNAVHEFLRMLGVRWYLPGELGEIVPKKTTIELPVIDKTIRPDFALRYPYQMFKQFASTTPEEVMWQLRLGLNEAPDVIGLSSLGHGINEVHSRPEVKKAHPEFFALWNGKRALDKFEDGAPCLSSDGLFKQNVKYVRAMFDLYDAPMVSVMPQDGYGFLCECELCKGKDTPARGWEGTLSDYIWGYVDRVAREVYKTHPNRKIICLAYGNSAQPPTRIDKLSPNIVVGMSQDRCQFDGNPDLRKRYEKLRQAWLEKMPEGHKQLLIWEYYLYHAGDSVGLPVVSPHAIARDLRSLRGISLGDLVEVYRVLDEKPARSLATMHLNLYVTSRFWWDAGQDVDALLDEYYTLYYGPARKEMKAFLEFAEAHWMKMTKSAADIDKALTLLDTARKTAGDTVYGKRIDLIVDHVRPLRQLRERLALGRKGVPQARAIQRVAADIKLDGKLDDKFWEGLQSYSLRDLETGKAPSHKTTFKSAWADTSVYFGIRCEDDTKSLNITATKNGDAKVWQGDNIELLLETQAHSYYQLAISPAGALVNVDRKERIDTRWSSAAQVATHIGDGYWSVEVRIPVANDLQGVVDPLNGVAGRIPSAVHPWYFNVCRQRVRKEVTELSAFSPTGRNDFHDKLKFGELIGR